MNKLSIVFGLILCIILPFSAISQEESVKKEKNKKERKEVNPNFKHKFTTFHLEARADFEYNYNLERWSNIDPYFSGSVEQHHYGFRGDYFNFLLGGDIGDHISYFFRQRIVPVKGYTELFDNTDFLYIQYKFNDQWSLRMGKEAIYVGGFEYDAPPIDVYYFTHYWGSFPCFLLGVSAAYTGFVSTHDRPNIHLEEDMEAETDKICDAIMDCRRDPAKYITPRQNLSFLYYRRNYTRQKKVNDLFNLKDSAEVLNCEERGWKNYKSLQEYVRALTEQKRAGQDAP